MPQLRVIAPLDGSEVSERALAYLPVLARVGDLRVRLLSVAETGRAAAADMNASTTSEFMKAYVFRQELRLKGEGFPVESVVRTGNPSLAIINEADHFSADLILMSTHGRLNMERWRLGSVTEKVARISYHDMLVIPPSVDITSVVPTVRAVLVPLDGSEVAEKAIPVAGLLAKALDAHIHLAQVVTMANMAGEASGRGSSANLERSKDYLQQAQAGYGLKQVVTSVLAGSPDESLLRYMRERDIDLIALTAHGHGTGSRVGLGRVVERLLRSDKPVLLIRSWEAGELIGRRTELVS